MTQPAQLFVLTGEDTLTISGRVINNLAYDDVSVIAFPSNIANSKTGKNKNTIIALDQSGNNADLTLRIVRGSGDDVFLQALLNSMQTNFSGFQLMDGTFVKRLGDGQGNIVNDVYTIAGGYFKKFVEVASNQQGGTDQAVAIYHITFVNSSRLQQ